MTHVLLASVVPTTPATVNMSSEAILVVDVTVSWIKPPWLTAPVMFCWPWVVVSTAGGAQVGVAPIEQSAPALAPPHSAILGMSTAPDDGAALGPAWSSGSVPAEAGAVSSRRSAKSFRIGQMPL